MFLENSIMLSILCTGGTFDKIYFDANSIFSIGDPQAEPLLKEANLTLEYEIESILKKDSLDITNEDRDLIVKKVVDLQSQQIIITHGTDGMVATAKTIADKNPLLLESKTIVLVGAMQPARMRYSDASFNLGFAVASVQLLAPGIYIAMNGRVFPYDKVAKNWDQARFELVDD